MKNIFEKIAAFFKSASPASKVVSAAISLVLGMGVLAAVLLTPNFFKENNVVPAEGTSEVSRSDNVSYGSSDSDSQSDSSAQSDSFLQELISVQADMARLMYSVHCKNHVTYFSMKQVTDSAVKSSKNGAENSDLVRKPALSLQVR